MAIDRLDLPSYMSDDPYDGASTDPWGRRPGDPWFNIPPDQGGYNNGPIAPGVMPDDPRLQWPGAADDPTEPPPAPAPPSPGGGGTPEFSYPEFNPPSWDIGDFVGPAPFEYGGYEPLTADTFQADPGYDFRLKEGTRAIENAASAQGLLRTGGTLKGLMSYGQGLASQEFGNVDARHFRNYQANRGNAADIYDRNYRNSLTDYVLGYNSEADEFNRALATHQTRFGNAAGVQGINQSSRDSMFGNLLSLYSLATRSLPTYTPGAQSPSFGFQY